MKVGKMGLPSCARAADGLDSGRERSRAVSFCTLMSSWESDDGEAVLCLRKIEG